MAGDAMERFKASFNRGVTTITVKTSSTLEKAKIKTHMESIDKEIEHLMTEIGKASYHLWESGNQDFSALNDQFEFIKSKQEEKEQLKKDFDSIDERDNQILGTSVVEEAKVSNLIEEEQNICPNCKIIYANNIRFCKKCGYKLKD